MKHFVGLGVSMKETAICVVDDTGQRVWEGSVPSTAHAIAAIILNKAPEMVRAGMETGPHAVWLWHALREQGIMVDCIHAQRAAAALKLQANKTDRNDAFGLARLVHSGWYEPVAIRTFDRYRMRAVLTARERIVRMSTTVINQIRGLAKTFGLTLSSGKGQLFELSVRRAIPDDVVLAICLKGCSLFWRASRISAGHSTASLLALRAKMMPAGLSPVRPVLVISQQLHL